MIKSIWNNAQFAASTLLIAPFYLAALCLPWREDEEGAGRLLTVKLPTESGIANSQQKDCSDKVRVPVC